MPPAPRPDNDPKRLEAIFSHPALAGRRDAWTDQLVQAAAAVTGCPIALVSVVDSDRQWFLGCHGLGVNEIPRDQSFCAYAILDDQPLIVEDDAAPRVG